MEYRRLIRAFSDSQGSVTVEFAMWLPLFVALFGVMIDSTLLLHRQTQLYDIARSASRAVAIGQVDAASAESYAAGLMSSAHSQASVATQNGFVTTTLSIPFADIVLFGDIVLGESTLSASVTMLQEASNGDDGS